MGVGTYAHESFRCKQCKHVFKDVFKYEETEYCKLCVVIHRKEINAKIRLHRDEIERSKSKKNTEIAKREEGKKQTKEESKPNGN